MPRKPAGQTKRRPPQVFIGLGYQTGLFNCPALSIGQKTEFSLLRVRRVIFTSAACLWSHFSCEIASLKQELNY